MRTSWPSCRSSAASIARGVDVVVDHQHALRGADAAAVAPARGCSAAAACAPPRSGQPDDELAALAGALAASPRCVPWCSSTMVRASARPTPRPVCGRLGRVAALHEHAEDAAEQLAARCRARCRAPRCAAVGAGPSLAAQRERDLPARVGVARRIVQHVGQRLGQAQLVALHEHRLRRQLDARACGCAASMPGRAASTARATIVAQVDALRLRC